MSLSLKSVSAAQFFGGAVAWLLFDFQSLLYPKTVLALLGRKIPDLETEEK